MITTLHAVGLRPLRYYDDAKGDHTVQRMCWEARDIEGHCIGELFKAAKHSFEYWDGGEMEEFGTFTDARRYITGTEG